MKRKLKLQVTRVTRLSQTLSGSAFYRFCQGCDNQVELVTKAQAAGILQVSESEMERLLSERWMHSIVTVTGNLWICKNSLFKK